MDIESFGQDPNPSINTTDRLRTPQRLKYEAEIRVFKNRFGDLESVRKTLGFSRRKMCQLLLVDPSAWTRWHSPGGSPPPHAYRALEWFLILEGRSELHPRIADIYLKGASSLNSDSTETKNITSAHDPRLESRITELNARIARLQIYVCAGPCAAVAVTALWYWITR